MQAAGLARGRTSEGVEEGGFADIGAAEEADFGDPRVEGEAEEAVAGKEELGFDLCKDLRRLFEGASGERGRGKGGLIGVVGGGGEVGYWGRRGSCGCGCSCD